MRKEKQDARRRLIEEAAYEILAERGYRSSSMLLIAKKARASNETLYRWYGSKQGLFTALVEENTRVIKAGLEACLEENSDPIQTLRKFGPALLGLVTSPRAIALNRAAAAEAESNEPGEKLGDVIAAAGRETISPLIERIFQAATELGHWPPESAYDASQTYVSLLISDLQIRRAIGVQDALSEQQCEARAEHALQLTMQLFRAEEARA